MLDRVLKRLIQSTPIWSHYLSCIMPLSGQAAPPKNKGKIFRVLAAKAALATRVDDLSDETASMRDGSYEE